MGISEIICIFASELLKLNILIIYAPPPRKVRERSERNPKGLTGEYLSSFIVYRIA